MSCAAVGKLTQVFSGEEGLCQLLSANPGKGRLSESQLLLVIQHAGSLGQIGAAKIYDFTLLHLLRTIRV
jgi:hypothetical protein